MTTVRLIGSGKKGDIVEIIPNPSCHSMSDRALVQRAQAYPELAWTQLIGPNLQILDMALYREMTYVIGKVSGPITLGTFDVNPRELQILIGAIQGQDWLWVKVLSEGTIDGRTGAKLSLSRDALWVAYGAYASSDGTGEDGVGLVNVSVDGKIGPTSWAVGVDRTDFTLLSQDTNRVLLAGVFIGDATFSSLNPLKSKNPTMYISSFKDNAFEWVRSSSGDGTSSIQAIAADPEGNIYVTGGFEGHIAVGETILSRVRGMGLFLGKLSPDGRWLWIKCDTGTLNRLGTGLAWHGHHLLVSGIQWTEFTEIFLMSISNCGTLSQEKLFPMLRLQSVSVCTDTCSRVYIYGRAHKYFITQLDPEWNWRMSQDEEGKAVTVAISNVGDIIMAKDTTLSYYRNELPSVPMGVLRGGPCHNDEVLVDFTGKTKALSGLVPGVTYYINLCGQVVPGCKDREKDRLRLLGIATSPHALLLN